MIRWKIRRVQRLRPSRQESILSATIEGLDEQIQESFDRIRSYGSQYKLDDTMLAVNIIDQFVEKKNTNYMTRIEIRITIRSSHK